MEGEPRRFLNTVLTLPPLSVMISGDYASSSDDEPEVEVEPATSQLDSDTSEPSLPISSMSAVDAISGFDDAALEYEIILDGEVVGTTHMTPAAARAALPGSAPLNNYAASTARTGPTPDSPSSPSICAACAATAPRYRCPGCSTMSCSLACVTAHKQQSGCTGKRPRSAYVHSTLSQPAISNTTSSSSKKSHATVKPPNATHCYPTATATTLTSTAAHTVEQRTERRVKTRKDKQQPSARSVRGT